MQFGIFDQNDRGPYPLGQQYENRLQLIEFYDSAGFRTYHMSEHHSTPLNLTPSPSVFLAAAAPRFDSWRMTRQFASSSHRATHSSGDPSSTTINSRFVHVWSQTLRIAWCKKSGLL